MEAGQLWMSDIFDGIERSLHKSNEIAATNNLYL